MRRWIIWSFERGSFQYDVLCALILIAIFLIPPSRFNDRPEYLRLDPVEKIRGVFDDDGNRVYVVQVTGAEGGQPGMEEDMENLARRALEDYLGAESEPNIYRVEPVENTWGQIEGYSFWIVQ